MTNLLFQVLYICFAILAVVIAFVVYKLGNALRRRRRFFQHYTSLTEASKQCKPMPLNFGLGQIYDLSDNTALIDNVLRFAQQHGTSDGVTMGSFGLNPWILITNPNYIKQICTSSHQKFPKPQQTYDPLRPLAGNGLVTNNDYKSWKKNRNLFNPLFSSHSIGAMYGKMQQQVSQAMDSLKSREDDCGVIQFKNIENWYSQLTLFIVAACIFGIDNSNSEHRSDLRDLSAIWNELGGDIWSFFSGAMLLGIDNWLKIPVPSNLHFKRENKKLRAIGKKFLEFYRNQNREGECQDENNSFSTQSDGRNDSFNILEKLLNATYEDGSKMSEEEMMDEIVTFLLAGHETTSSLLSFTTYLLCMNPEIQEKLYEEVSRFATLNYDTVDSEMPYLDRVVKESLRVFPPVTFVDKTNTTDIELGPHHIPKGSLLTANIIGLHRSPKYWNHPDKFDPDRWIDENLKKEPVMQENENLFQYVFIPFSIGQRNCIGKYFAQTEAKLIIASLLKDYTIRLDREHFKKLTTEAGITVKPIDLHVTLKRRHCK